MIPAGLLRDVLTVERFDTTGTDLLGNEVGAWVTIGTIQARVEDHDVSLLKAGRRITVRGKRIFFNRGEAAIGDRLLHEGVSYDVEALYHRRLGGRGFFRIDAVRAE